MATITLPLVDLRKEPIHLPKGEFDHHPLRLSQLLFGEQIHSLKKEGEWLYIEALEQLYNDPDKGWTPYLGWVHETEICATSESSPPSHVIVSLSSPFSYGTLLLKPMEGSRPLPVTLDRKLLATEAKKFVGQPYLWGGRGSYPHGSVDCSGLVNLLYRAQGVAIPRDAADQCAFSKPVDQLQPGDPLYLAKEREVNHVILKLDEKTYIEAPETGKTIRLLTWGRDIWEEKGRIQIHDRQHTYTPYPRTLF